MAEPRYSSAFETAFALLMRDEGGYADIPGDRGGPTKFGISQREYPDLDIKNLTREQVKPIYWRDWWEKFNFETLPAAIAVKCFLIGVNTGSAHAIKCLQRAARACGHPLVEDGVLGPVTARTAHEIEARARAGQTAAPALPSPLISAFRSEAAGYYRALAAIERGRRPNADRDFLSGWLNRAYE